MALLRFAPSPTGPLHLGGMRMALFNHLIAKKNGGQWILRIEDTDAARTVQGSVDGIRKALEWAGLEYDYGPGKGGPHAPYFQSARKDLYLNYARKLLDTGHAYRCFCSPDRLQEVREKLARSGANSTYDKKCLNLTDEEVARRVRAGENSIVRFNESNLPSRPPTRDIIFGNLKDAHASLATDPVLLKSDQFPTYHLASVVDDHEMGITHVLRGEEWLTSFPLHLDLYSALKLSPPKFAHLPLLLNPDGSKMSKRNADVQVVDYIRRGWEPEALLNWLALTGWGVQHHLPEKEDSSNSRSSQLAPASTAVLTLSELIEQFDLSAITQRSSVLDPPKLEYLNKRHLSRLWSTPEGLKSLAKKVHLQIEGAFPTSKYTTIEYIEQVISLLQGRLTTIYDVPEHGSYFFEAPDFESADATSLRKNINPKRHAQVLKVTASYLQTVKHEDWTDDKIRELLVLAKHELGLTTTAFMRSLRYCLTGCKDGPAVADIMSVLGGPRTRDRLTNADSMLV